MAKQIKSRVAVQSSDTFVGVEQPARGPQQTGPSRAARNAAALAQALGTTGKAMALNQTQKQTDAGAFAASTGEVDIDTLRQQSESAAWVRGAEKVIGRSRAIEDEGALKEWYASEFDKNGTLPELRQQTDAWLKDRYEGLDPAIAREVAPYLKRATDAVMAAHGNSEATEAAQLVAEGLNTSMKEWLGRPVKTAEEWDALRNEYTALYPTKAEGLQALATDVANHMRTTGSELDVVDNKMFDKLRSNPATRDILEDGIEDGKKVRIAEHIEATKVERGEAYEEITQLGLAQNEEAFFLKLEEYSQPDDLGISMLTEGEIQTQIGAFYRQSRVAVMTPLMVDAYDQMEGNMIPKDQRDDTFKAWLSQAYEKYPADEVYKRAVQRIVGNGFIPADVKDMFETASPSNPERFSEAFGFYEQFQKEYPEEIGKYIKEDNRRQYEAFEQLSADFGQERALEMMRGEHDPSLYDTYTPADRRAALTDVLDDISEVEWSWAEIEQTPRMAALVEKRMRYFSGFNYTIDKAAELAIRDIDTRHQVIDGQMYPANSPWGTAGNDAADWYLSEQSITNDGSTFDLTPAHGQPGFAYLRDTGNMFDVVGEKVRISEIVDKYKTNQDNIRDQAIIRGRDGTDERMRERAVDRLYPDIPRAVSVRPEMQFAVRDQRIEAWNGLTPAEQDAVLGRLEDEDRADADSKKRRLQAQFDTLPYTYQQ